MSPRYIKRSLEKTLKMAIKEFPVVTLTGPRQAGKTTLLKHLLPTKYRYVSLEPPDVRAAALADPRGFLAYHEAPVIFDEIQHVPQLLPYIKELVDADRHTCGRYVLTGSQNLMLASQVGETLAGRTAILKLLPLTNPEIDETPATQFFWEKPKRTSQHNIKTFWKQMLRGYYPELAEHPRKDAYLWHSSYMQTYLERDVRTLRQIGDLSLFQIFLRSIAARSGQLFQMSDVARDIGVAVNTIKAWIAILEASYQIIILRPYFTNTQKRLVKTPKIYFADVGTLCYLCGLKDPEHAAAGPMGGAIVETAVVTEIYKRFLSRGEEPQLYFWRTHSGNEVDLLVETAGQVIPIEIKQTATPKPQNAQNILKFQKDLPAKAKNGYVIHLGNHLLPLAPSVEAIPFDVL